jgi:DNA polymerase elongation subunit (family B)
MYDIETSTHYFIANGINTHNCQNANGVGYDIPYICNRLNQFKMLERLSPFKKIEKIQWAHHNYFEIFGISIVDYMELYKKFATTKMPSYRLAEISKKELDETKLEYDGDLNSLWMNDIHRFIDYNRKDVELIKKMDDKLHYIELDDELRRIGIVNFEDTIDNANIHDSIVVRFMNHQGYIVKSKKKYPAINYPGGYTYLRWPGIYNFVGDLDFTSLYPFIIRRLNISPETKQKDGEIISEAGIRFTKKFRGAVPSILDWEFQQRNEYKKKMKEAGKIGDKAKEKEYDIKQYAFKILMNSMYGWLGYVGSRLFDLDLSRSVTMTGQVLDRFAIAEAEKEGETVITADTDSLLFTNPNFKSLQEVTKRGHELKDIINKRVEKFVEEKYNVKNEDFGLNEKFVDADYKFNLKNEFAATRGIFFFKRRYCMKIKMREGYDTDKNEFKGVSIVRSSTPEFAKKYLTQLFEIVLTENDYKDKFYKAYAEYGEFVKTADQQILGIPFNISKKLEEYTKILPANVRGCMRWNAMFKDRVNFDEVVKGKYYYLSKVPENYKSYFEVDVTNKKELVLSVPEGFALPDGFEVNRIKHAELTVESPTENLRNIIDDRGYRLMCKYVERLIGKKDKYNEDQRKELRGMLKEVKDDIKKSEIPEKAKEIVDQIIFRDKIKRILDRMTDMGVEDDEEDEE